MKSQAIQTVSFLIAVTGLLICDGSRWVSATPENPQPIGIFDDHGDFVDSNMDGDITYDAITGEYVIRGTGQVIGNGGDFGHLAYSEVTGDFRIKARVSTEGPRAALIGCVDDPEDLDSTWYTVWVDYIDAGGVQSFWRTSRGINWETTREIPSDLQDGLVEVVREGNVFSSYYYDIVFGEWVEMDSRTIEVTDPIYVCLGSFSGSYSHYNTAHFSEVELTVSEDLLRKLVAEDITDALNAHDLERVSTYFLDDMQYDFTPMPPIMEGKEQAIQFFQIMFQALPDWHITRDQILVSGNIAVSESTVTGTQLGEWLGYPPLGAVTEAHILLVIEFAGTKIQHITEYLDIAGILIQLGHLPVPTIPPLVPSVQLPSPITSDLTPLESIQKVCGLWSDHNLNGFIEMQDPDAVLKVSPLGIPLDRAGWYALTELYYQAFSDIHQEIVRTIDLGDGWVLAEVIITGTNDGPYLGNPATYNTAAVRAAHLWRYVNGLGKIGQTYYDEITLQTQLYSTSSAIGWEFHE